MIESTSRTSPVDTVLEAAKAKVGADFARQQSQSSQAFAAMERQHQQQTEQLQEQQAHERARRRSSSTR